ncbi:MAG: hypothetical protein JSV49_12335, partial [Thermoplasmata archaeon]
YDAETNKPMMAEVVLEPEFIIPKMKFMVLGIRFGQLECNDDIDALAKWDGFIQVTKGHIIPIRTVAFEMKGEYEMGCDDYLYPQENPLTVEWRASTIPCWDGLIVLIAVPEKAEPAPHVTIHTAKWESVFTFRELVDFHEIYTVDDLGNEVEIKTKLIKMPEPEKPERPPKDEPCPEKPPHPEDPPKDEKPEHPPRDPNDGPKGRGEKDEKPEEELEHEETFGLEIGEEDLKMLREKIHNHIRECSRHEPFVTKTDECGFYGFRELPPGHYRMWVRARGYIEYYNELDLKPGSHLVIDVYLRPAEFKEGPNREFVLVKGQVTHIRSGEPIANAKLTFERVRVENEQPPGRPLSEGEGNGEEAGTRGEHDEKNDRPKERPEEPPEDPDQTPPPERPETNELPVAVTNERGYFEIKLPRGYYKLTVQARGYEDNVQRLDIREEVPEFLTIQLTPSNPDENGGQMSAENADKDEAKDAGAQGLELYSNGEYNIPLLSLIIAGLLMAILIPLFLMVRHRKAKKDGSSKKGKGSKKAPVKSRSKSTNPKFTKPKQIRKVTSKKINMTTDEDTIDEDDFEILPPKKDD